MQSDEMQGREMQFVGQQSDLTDELVEAYARDGAVLVRGAVAQDMVDRLRAATERALGNPSRFGEAYGGVGGDAAFRGDKFMWMNDPDFRMLALSSPLPGIAARLMRSARVNLLYDHMLVKEPGSTVPTKWHHDQNFWPVDGLQVCSAWVALDTVDAGNGRVAFVRGSHLWPQRFQAMDFSRMEAVEDGAHEPIPDFDSDPDRYDVITWDMQPGDAVVFAGLSVHGAPGNVSDRRRRAVSVRYVGDDVRYAVKRRSIALPADPGLAHGAPFGGPVFPQAYPPA